MGCFVFDGVDLSQTFEVLDISAPAIAPVTADLRQALGMDGAAYAGSTLGPMEIAVKVRVATQTIDQRDIQQALADAVAPLRTDGPKALSLAQGRSRMAILANDTALEFESYSAICELKFLCPDPVAYGEQVTKTVPSGGSLTFEVGGTYPTRPTITASAVRNASALVWGLKLDNSDFIHVATGSGSARSVAIDCEKRTLKIAGAAALPTLDSDWLELSPGTHTLSMDYGTGAATVKYHERWL